MRKILKRCTGILSAVACLAAGSTTTDGLQLQTLPIQAEATGIATIAICQVDVSLDDLKAADYQVTVPITISENSGFDTLSFGAEWDTSKLQFEKYEPGTVLITAEITNNISITSSGWLQSTTGSSGWISLNAAIDVTTGSFYKITGNGTLCSLTFKVTENAEVGDTYAITSLSKSPVSSAYTACIRQDNNSESDPVSSGAIHIVSSSSSSIGDPNNDSIVDVSDAVWTLTTYAKQAAGQEISITDTEKNAADVNGDGTIDVTDAVLILTYYAKQAAGQDPQWENII